MLMVDLHLEGKLLRRNLDAAIEHAVFASGFEGEDGAAAQRWLMVMERKLGRKLMPEDEDASLRKEEAKEIWMEESAIEEERLRRAAANKASKSESKKT